MEGKTQQQMSEELHIGQSAVNNRIKLAKWKQIEKMIRYIESLIETEYVLIGTLMSFSASMLLGVSIKYLSGFI